MNSQRKIKIHEVCFEIVDDMRRRSFSDHKMEAYAKSLAHVFRCVIEKSKTGAWLQAEVKNSRGGVQIIDLPMDYTHPAMLAYVENHLLPRASVLMEYAIRRKNMLSNFSRIFGDVAEKAIVEQDITLLTKRGEPSFPEGHSAQIISLAAFR